MNSSILFNRFRLVAIGLLIWACCHGKIFGQTPTRIKDVAVVQGVRDNQLIGYGLVAGLDGQGDSDPISTQQAVSNLLLNFQINVSAQNVKAKNTAAVIVTALIHSGATNGSKIDVVVSSLSDAKSLQGGTLLRTELKGTDGVIYAVAQGPLSIGGFYAGGGSGGASATLTKNHPTVGEIPDGAIVEREIATDYFANGVLEVSLRDGDFTSAVRMANAINEQIAPLASAISQKTVRIYVPKESQPPEKQLEFIARVENVVFQPDLAARIVMNEKTGTIVANSRIKIDSVAVAHGNLTVSIVNSFNVSQPNSGTGNGNFFGGNSGGVAQVPVTRGSDTEYVDPSTGATLFLPQGQAVPSGYQVALQNADTPKPADGAGTGGAAGGPQLGNGPSTAITPTTTLNAEEEKKDLVVFNDMPTVQDVAAALNALGVTPRDMMAIFQEMKEAGALQAELIVH